MEAVRVELERILSSRAFLKAESLSRLLRFIVEQELAGKRDRLREQIIAEDVFGRQDFDPQADTIVRTQARRLRDRLESFYRDEAQSSPVRIHLEKGSYVPVFVTAASPQAVSESSIAVLPFLNLTGNSDEEYFSDGLTEEVINALSKIRGLRVVARTSAFMFKARDIDIREIGKRLNVASILEGSVRRSAGRVRVTAQLISARTGFHHWSQNYDRQVGDLMSLQDDIAEAIAATLLQERPAARPPSRRPPANMEAYYLFLKGVQSLNRITTDGVQEAIRLFGESMKLDDSFAPASAYLAMTLTTIGWVGMAPASAVLSRARDLAERARSLDPSSIEAQLSLAQIRFAYEHDVEGALKDFGEILDAAPGYSFARLAQSYAMVAHHRFEEANEAALRAVELDPLSIVNVYNQAVVAYFSRRFGAAESFARATIELAPAFAEGHMALGVLSMDAGRYEEALQLLQKAISLNATIGIEHLVICYCRMRQWEKAEAALRRLAELAGQGYVAPHRFAIATSAFPDVTRTLNSLEEAWNVGDPRLIWITVWPVFDHLRAEPRFRRLCENLGLSRFC